MKASDNPFPGILIRESANDGSDFSNPSADYRVAFLGEDGLWHVKDSSGTVTDPFSGSGAVATDAIWDAAGDLAVGTGANTAARLAIGAANTVLGSNGTTAAWVANVAPWAILPYSGVVHRTFAVLGAANRMIAIPVVIPVACTITGVRVRIGTSSGNVSVGLIDAAGTSRLATSGAVASPGTGLRNIAFTGNYSAAAGRYYIAVSADNNTITFSSNYDGSTADPATAKYQETAHPIPATPSLTEPIFSINAIGLVSGGYPS